ncbi:hypothetical protein FRB93_007497 [Tulasnella sp. JGI-2019a]|nr:hypothetical protein FRB93_007497 [Tulasnella sp. JGI-2019a]
MPISSKGIHFGPQSSTKLHYASLSELDSDLPGKRLEEVQRFAGDRRTTDSLRPKLLVCHDYKGGYKDDPFNRSYTFNFWGLCDTLVYFAHHRVSTPPPSWVNTSHRNGTKILGTLIFEPDAEQDCLNLLAGPALAAAYTSTATSVLESKISPLSTHYACALAQLACDRGFDGWLLNFECDLPQKEEQGRSLSLWIRRLKQELRERVGPHAEVVWYDSVTVQGQLAWQCQLNSLNLPWLLSADSMFLDYHWKITSPDVSTRYFDSVAMDLRFDKARRDIYFGIDVWGRGCHGGGGFQLHHAMDHIQPSAKGLGLSVAVFGPAWTWESKEDEEGRTWAKWWNDEVRFWVGPDDGVSGDPGSSAHLPAVNIPPSDGPGEKSPPCFHGPYRSISHFVDNRARGSQALPFYTTYSPGVGLAWFVQGERVMTSSSGWTDVDKQTSIGDYGFLWPAPAFILPGKRWVRDGSAPCTEFCFDDGWLGGSSLSLTIPAALWEEASLDSSSVAVKEIIIPLEQLILRHLSKYRVHLVYKFMFANPAEPPQEMEEFAYVGCTTDLDDKDFVLTSHTSERLTNGWNAADVCCEIRTGTNEGERHCIIGLRLQYQGRGASPCPQKILIGLVSARIEEHIQADPVVLGIRCLPTILAMANVTSISGILEWHVGLRFDDIQPSESVTSIVGIDDPRPPWGVTTAQAPTFVYHNVYALAHTGELAEPLRPEDAIFVATTGTNGHVNSLRFDGFSLPLPFAHADGSVILVRLYIRGVTEAGQVIPWPNVPYIDIGSMDRIHN